MNRRAGNRRVRAVPLICALLSTSVAVAEAKKTDESEDERVLAVLYPTYDGGTGKLSSGAEVSIASDRRWAKGRLVVVKRLLGRDPEACAFDLALVETVAGQIRVVTRQDAAEKCEGTESDQTVELEERSYLVKAGLRAFGLSREFQFAYVDKSETSLWIVTPRGFKRVFSYWPKATDVLDGVDCSLSASLRIVSPRGKPSSLRVKKTIHSVALRGCRFKGVEVWRWNEGRQEFERQTGGCPESASSTCMCCGL